MISVFQDGCLGVVTFVPSERTIFSGSAINIGMRMPIPVNTMNPICETKTGQDLAQRQHLSNSRRFHFRLRIETTKLMSVF